VLTSFDVNEIDADLIELSQAAVVHASASQTATVDLAVVGRPLVEKILGAFAVGDTLNRAEKPKVQISVMVQQHDTREQLHATSQHD